MGLRLLVEESARTGSIPAISTMTKQQLEDLKFWLAVAALRKKFAYLEEKWHTMSSTS
jgi:hypothetical protein